MLTKKVVVASIFGALLVTLTLIFRPVPQASYENTSLAYGVIEEVLDAGDDRIIFKLRNDRHIYYLDEGLKSGLTLALLKDELPGQDVAIHYVKHWTPVDPLNRRKCIAKVEINKTTLYSILK